MLLHTNSFIGDTERVKWSYDNVELTSPTVEECEAVMSQLKSSRKTNKHWKISLHSTSPDSSLIIFSNINECLVRTLDISFSPLDIHSVNVLSRALISNKTLTHLLLYSSSLAPNSVEMITNALSTNTTLKTLELIGDDIIRANDMIHFTNLSSVNTTLEEISFEDCPNITKFDGQSIAVFVP